MLPKYPNNIFLKITNFLEKNLNKFYFFQSWNQYCLINLKKKYRLESESLLDEIVYRLEVDNSDVVKNNIKALLSIAYEKIKSLK